MPIVEAMPGPRPVVTCAICERTLLAGERTARFSPDGRGWLDVCVLCKDTAAQRGWFRDGGPSLPVELDEPRPRPRLGGLLRRRATQSRAVAEPILRRLSGPEESIVGAA